MIRVIIGSPSILKLNAGHRACDQLEREAEVLAIPAESGVPPQPIGAEQITLGATNRADAARKVDPACYAVGIENGLEPRGTGTVDVAYVVIYAPSGRKYVLKSAAVVVPPAIVARVLELKQARTCGQIEAELSGCDHRNPHPVWSKGRADREQLLVSVLYAALFVAITNEEGASK